MGRFFCTRPLCTLFRVETEFFRWGRLSGLSNGYKNSFSAVTDTGVLVMLAVPKKDSESCGTEMEKLVLGVKAARCWEMVVENNTGSGMLEG